jgi:hypothetical protein
VLALVRHWEEFVYLLQPAGGKIVRYKLSE